MAQLVIGFTGTSSGMTLQQKNVIDYWLTAGDLVLSAKINGGVLAVHGDCIGADADFHELCIADRTIRIRLRPCDHPKRAWCEGADEVMPVKKPLARNVDIVKDCDLLVACPPTMEEILRSGTWHTIRQARKAGKPIAIVWPDGTVTREN